MSQPLPIDGFQWLDNNVAINDDEAELFYNTNAITNLCDQAEHGYIFEVDLEYPKTLHDLHNDFPFCAQKQALPDEVFDIIGVKKNKNEKLLLTLYDKEKYVLHYRMLKLALNHGLILKKVHRILKYRQSCWLKPYIHLNTELRKSAVNNFEKKNFKYLINSIFGKTMENIRLRSDIKLVNHWGGRFGARMLIVRPNFKHCRIFDENLVAIEMCKTHILMNKPIIVGMSILDISKLTMYKFLYEFLKPKYQEKCCVAYTDTDSFILSIQTSDFYEDIRKNIALFDTSDYPIPNRYNIKRENKKVPGLFKDELNGEIMVEFAGLRAKCYAIRPLYSKLMEKEKFEEIEKKRKRGLTKEEAVEIKKSKGVKKSVVEHTIKFDDYVHCLQEKSIQTRKQKTIRSIKHSLYSIEQSKIALNPADDKRYIIEPDGINTLAWGHYSIAKKKNNNEK